MSASSQKARRTPLSSSLSWRSSGGWRSGGATVLGSSSAARSRHMDSKQLPVFSEPGHWAHGDRSRQARRPNGSRQVEFAHCVIDDHSRLSYVEIHPFDRGDIAAAVLRRAIDWFAEQGCRPVEAVMTDNAFAYTNSTAFQTVLHAHHAKHIRTPPRTPRWNGKVCVLAWLSRPGGRRGSPLLLV